MSRSAATRPWSIARSPSAGKQDAPARDLRVRQHWCRKPTLERGGPALPTPPPPPCWPKAIRAVRGWLTPSIVLQRWWRAWSNAPPPPELQALIDAVTTGQTLNLYPLN